MILFFSKQRFNSSKTKKTPRPYLYDATMQISALTISSLSETKSALGARIRN